MFVTVRVALPESPGIIAGTVKTVAGAVRRLIVPVENYVVARAIHGMIA